MKSIPQKERPRLVVMLTYNDLTVPNAEEVFELCRNSAALYWGMKEEPLPLERMKALFARMKECGKRTVLEVVGYDEASGLAGVEIAAACGVDYMMGTKYHPAVAECCRKHGIGYMPFIGTPQGRPSVLTGEIEEIVNEGRHAVAEGVFGVDLLGYRYTGNPVELNSAVVAGVGASVCLAGSIDSYTRLDEVKRANPWAFTIGSAFFDNKFDGTICEQIDKVVAYIDQ